MRGLVILGSTGTIGENTLAVARQHPDRFRIVALAARSNVEALFEQCRRCRPDYAALLDRPAAMRLAERLSGEGIATRVLSGPEGLTTVAGLPEAELVMAAIVGAAGLAPTLAAAAAGKQLLLANKEALVLAGPLLIEAARASGARILPIDSEHNAIVDTGESGGGDGHGPGRPSAIVPPVIGSGGAGVFRSRLATRFLAAGVGRDGKTWAGHVR
jgi:1-deoxy-D-xylulose-5-phosphate reductoisomerase